MSYDNLASKNKYSKVGFQEYLSNINEPLDEGFCYTPSELRIELLDSNFVSRKKLRSVAQRLKGRYL